MAVPPSRLDPSRFCQQLTWDDIDPDYLNRLISAAREEDLAGSGLRAAPDFEGDVTTRLLRVGQEGQARLMARTSLCVAGMHLVPLILEAYSKDNDDEAHFEPGKGIEDGLQVEPGTPLGILSGNVSVILQAERVVLNFLQHLSGVATETSIYVSALCGSSTRLLDTRKTTPGLRVLEKYAVARGGGWNHRIGLFDRVMIKDNHLGALGDPSELGEVVSRARKSYPGLPVEVEVDAIEQLEVVLETGAEVILLDNFGDAALHRAIRLIDGRACTEASGSIQLARIAALADLGLDFISSGAIIHQSVWKDISLDWD